MLTDKYQLLHTVAVLVVPIVTELRAIEGGVKFGNRWLTAKYSPTTPTVWSTLDWRGMPTPILYIAGNNLTCHRYVDYGNVRQPGLWLTVGAKYHIRL